MSVITISRVYKNAKHFVNGVDNLAPIPIGLAEFKEASKKGVDVILPQNKVTLAQNIMASLVGLYFDTVDSDDLSNYRNLYGLFSDDIVYDRCELHIDGKEEFVRFFEDRFKNLKIKHKVEEIIPFRNQVIVIGSFSGKNTRLQKPVEGRFVDVHEFDERALNYGSREDDIVFTHEQLIDFFRQYGGIKKRRTYLAVDCIQKHFSEYRLTELDGFFEEEIVEDWNNEYDGWGYTQKLVHNNGNTTYITKFIRMGRGFIFISGPGIEQVILQDLRSKNNGDLEYFDSSLGAEVIK